MSTYLANLMRHGSSIHNGRTVFSGTVVTVEDYGGGAFGVTNPLLIRFSPTEETIVDSGTLSLDFSSATWGLEADAGEWSLCVGLQRLSSTSAQVVVGISCERNVTTALPSSCDHLLKVAASVPSSGKIVWCARLSGVKRQGGNWITANSWMEE
jgi:hypothetical protein